MHKKKEIAREKTRDGSAKGHTTVTLAVTVSVSRSRWPIKS